MKSPIRVTEVSAANMASGLCKSADALSETQLTGGNHTHVTVLCRSCLLRLLHAGTSRLLLLENDRTNHDRGE
jgi:hypothetical protein